MNIKASKISIVLLLISSLLISLLFTGCVANLKKIIQKKVKMKLLK